MRTAPHVAVLAAMPALVVASALTGCSPPAAPPDAVGPADVYVDLVLELGNERAEQEYLRYQEALAACMADAGFEYVPTLAGLFFIEAPEVDPPYGSRAFAEQYGYGFRSQPGRRTASEASDDDPNDAIIAQMSEAEASEYYLARNGTGVADITSGDIGVEVEDDWGLRGCEGEAQHQTAGGTPETDPVYLDLRAEVDRIEAEVVPADADVIAADAAWAGCMADAGFPGYSRQPEAAAQQMESSDAPPGDRPADPAAPAGPGPTKADPEAIAREIEIATADWDCTEKVGYRDAVARVRNEAQQAYVDAHRGVLDAWLEEFGLAADGAA